MHPYGSPEDGKREFEGGVITKIVQGNYNCLYIGSVKEGVSELNLTSGQVRNLLAIDESGESIFCRDLLFMTLILCQTMLSMLYIKIVKKGSGSVLISEEWIIIPDNIPILQNIILRI